MSSHSPPSTPPLLLQAKTLTEVSSPFHNFQQLLTACRCIVILSSSSIRTTSTLQSLDTLIDADLPHICSAFSLPNFPSSSSLSDGEDTRFDIAVSFNGEYHIVIQNQRVVHHLHQDRFKMCVPSASSISILN